jgi:hypothetical protein
MDLSTIVSRMRSKAGPDISNFQQSFEATYGVSEQDHFAELAQDSYDEMASEAELESWNKEIRSTESDQSYEPYRPEMLPGTSAFKSAGANQQPGASSGLPKAGSLRESLLKKPLGSLYRKD